MSVDWPIVQLFECASFQEGYVNPTQKKPEYFDGEIKWLRAVDLNNGFVKTTSRTLSKEGFESAGKSALLFEPGTLAISKSGTIGRVGILQDYMCGNRAVINIKVDAEKCNNLFIFYVLIFNRSTVENLAIGSVQKNLYTSALGKLEFTLPPRPSQDAIAKILSGLDNKIELNRQTNQTLEQIAQAIFKSWFVDFEPTRAKIIAQDMGANSAIQELAAQAIICGAITLEQLADTEPQTLNTWLEQSIQQKLNQANPTGINPEQLKTTAELFPNALVESELGDVPEGWEVKALDEIAHYQNGLALQKFRPKDEEESLPVLKIAQLRKGFADGEERASANIKPECIVDNGDVVFSWSGSLIVDIWCGGKVALNQHLFKVTSHDYPKWFYYYWTKRHLEIFQQIAADKAVTMGHIKREHLSQAKCLVPTDNLLELSLINSLLEKQVLLSLENFSLESIRDALLPKLLSGELDVSVLADDSAPAIKTKEVFDV